MFGVLYLPIKRITGDLLTTELQAQGLPVTEVYVTSDKVAIVSSPALTESETATATAVLDAHTAVTPKTPEQVTRQLARTSFGSTSNPTEIATRNTARALYRSIRQTRDKLNEVIAYLNANGASISPLANRTFAQAMAGAQALVNAETDPTAD